MIRNRRLRRALAGVFVVSGALLMWLSPSVSLGLMAFGLGLVLELAGLAIERRATPRADALHRSRTALPDPAPGSGSSDPAERHP